jgi:tagaturonate reductase
MRRPGNWKRILLNGWNESNSFHNTLVDRIVPGYPKDEIEDYQAQLEYKDNLIV